MLPHRWAQTHNTPYSSRTPLLERSVRHADKIPPQQAYSFIGMSIMLSIVLPLFILLTKDATTDFGILFPLLIAWGVTLTTIFGSAILGATSTHHQRTSSHYQLIWLTPISNRALGNSLFFDIMYRMRFGLLLTLAMAPTLILGMIHIDAWAVKSCIWIYEIDQCHPLYGETISPYSSVVYGILMWMICVSLVFIATMAAIGLTCRWHNSAMAAAATVIVTICWLGLILLFSAFVVTPPLSNIDGWGAPVTIILLFVLCSIGWMFVRHQRISENSLKLVVVTLWAMFANIACFGFIFWPSDVQANLLYLYLMAIVPLLAYNGVVRQFWRGARSFID
jgi:hypothetical protein